MNRSDAKATASTFVRALYSSDFRADASRLDAARRARPLSADPLRESLTTQGGHAGATWMELQRARGWVQVDIEDVTEYGQEEGNTSTHAVSSWLVTLTYHGAELPTEELLAHVTTRKIHGKWSVTSLQLE